MRNNENASTGVARSNGNRIAQRIQLHMTRSALNALLMAICSRAPECGGILLGPVGSNDITDFYFDQGATCSAGTYTPDHITLREKMRKEWLPQGLDMKGFAHSHPGQFDRLSTGDLRYIARLLEKNPDMPWFAAPIVIPGEFRLRVWVVPRQQPGLPVEAELIVL